MSGSLAEERETGSGLAAGPVRPSPSAWLAAARGDEPVRGERGITPIAGRSGLRRGGKALALLGLLAGSGVFLAATGAHPHGHRTKPEAAEPVKQVVDYSSVRAEPERGRGPSPNGVSPTGQADDAAAPTLANPGIGAPSLTPGFDPTAASETGAGQTTPAGAGPTSGAGARDGALVAAQQAAAQRTAKLQAIRSAPLLVFTANVKPDAETRPPAPLAARAESGGASELDQLRRGSTIGLVRAQRLANRNFLVAAGALLPCVLETAIDSSAAGFVTCRIPRDVYSDDGAVVLMEKGSRVLGEYRSRFQQGRARIFVLWDRITTPGGVAVDVSSPAADALGRAGFDGAIDSHFWKRFGGALLLTSVSGGLSAAATADAKFASIGQAPNEAAALALQNSINIPPTLTKPQGAEVGIFVSRDLDFSGVYALKAR